MTDIAAAIADTLVARYGPEFFLGGGYPRHATVKRGNAGGADTWWASCGACWWWSEDDDPRPLFDRWQAQDLANVHNRLHHPLVPCLYRCQRCAEFQFSPTNPLCPLCRTATQ